MGLFDSFTGASQRRDQERGYTESRDMINAGYNRGRGNLRRGYGDATEQFEYARGAINDGAGVARGDITTGRDRALGQIEPYTGAGSDATGLYRQAIGLDGADAQRSFMDNYQSHDPFRAFNEENAMRNIMRSYNAAGMADSGASRLAAARANLERGSTDYQNHLNRLLGLVDRGAQFAGQAAGIESQAGSQLAGYGYQQGSDLAGIHGRQAGLDYGYGQDRAQLATNQAMTNAGNRINFANSLADSRGVGMNNLMRLAGLGVDAYSAAQ